MSTVFSKKIFKTIARTKKPLHSSRAKAYSQIIYLNLTAVPYAMTSAAPCIKDEEP